MVRIHPVNEQTAPRPTAQLLNTVRKKLGSVPNLIATMASSPAVAQAYLSFSQALASGSLSARLREQIALTVGQANECDYCLAAHTALGKGAGLTEKETCDARQATSHNERERIVLQFAQKMVKVRGLVADADVESLRESGYTDGEVSEIVANVSLNIFTNYFNHVAGTEVDFPAAPALCAA